MPFCFRRAGLNLAIVFPIALGLSSIPLAARAAPEPPLFSGGAYDPSIPTPASVLGFEVGDRPARHAEAIRYFEAVAAAAPKRVVLTEYARTYEGRELVYALVSSEENIARRDAIRAATARLADTRGLSRADENELVEKTPATVWLAYSIHGDELSSTDAAIAVLYQLAAGTDTLTARLRRELLVAIDPMENPDGRDRYLAQIGSLRGAVPNADVQSLQHRGFWPFGRGNHYLFDLNRDWFYLVHPESRGRVAAILEWHPVVLVDSHEMGSLDTYLFSPPRAPFNPNLTPDHFRWWKTFASDQARAFDRHGWSYYTRDWNEELFPGYGSSWSLYSCLVGILYEQASADGSPVIKSDGTVMTYLETVHHHVVSSLANCETAARNRAALLHALADFKRRGIEEGKSGPVRAYLVDPSGDPARAARFADALLRQTIEVYEATAPFRAGGLHDAWGRAGVAREFPAGTLVVPLDQPMKALAQAILEFDVEIPDSFLVEERHYVEKFGDSRLYETTAWSLPLSYGLDAYWTGGAVGASLRRVTEAARATGAVLEGFSQYGYLIDYADGAAGIALARALERGLVVRAVTKAFSVEGRSYARGSLLFTSRSNPDGLASALDGIAKETGVIVRPVGTALAQTGPDLGSNDVVLLTQPRIALVAGDGVDFTQYGALWRLLDDEFRVRVSSLELSSLGGVDLSKYNVLVLPNAGGRYKRALGDEGAAKIREWVEAGGTLVGIGSGAAFAADSSAGLTSIRTRGAALAREIPEWPWEKREREGAPTLSPYAPVVPSDGKAAGAAKSDESAKGGKGAKEEGSEKGSGGGGDGDEKALAKKESLLRRYAPHGAFLRVDLDDEHFLTAGYGAKVAVHFASPEVFVAEDPEQVVGRFAAAESLRVAGLLWPEARERLARTGWLMRESRGKGQVILFADSPVFRGAARGLERLVVNALLVAPGAGTNRPTPW